MSKEKVLFIAESQKSNSKILGQGLMERNGDSITLESVNEEGTTVDVFTVNIKACTIEGLESTVHYSHFVHVDLDKI